MKILVFYQNFTVPQGSWSTRVYEFARRWVEAGDEVTVVTGVFDKSGLKPRGVLSRINVEGIDVRVVNIPLANKHGVAVRLATWAAYALVANWYALTLRADVVLASSGPLTIGLPGLVARYLRRRPLVFEVRDLWPEGAIQLGLVSNPLIIRAARAFEKACYRGATRVVALSQGMADWIFKTYGFTHVDVVPNASDNQLFGAPAPPLQRPDWAQGKQLVVYTGSIGRMDDCRQIIEMARVLEARGADDIVIAILGDGGERPELEAEVAARGPRNLHFMGLVPKAQVVQWLQDARCSLLAFKAVPCLDTVSPNKMFDAFAAGVPVAQATQGWIKELLEREKCGLTAPPNDPEAFADAVELLCRDETAHREMAANARRVACEQFDRDLLAARFRAILAEACPEPATAPQLPEPASRL